MLPLEDSDWRGAHGFDQAMRIAMNPHIKQIAGISEGVVSPADLDYAKRATLQLQDNLSRGRVFDVGLLPFDVEDIASVVQRFCNAELAHPFLDYVIFYRPNDIETTYQAVMAWKTANKDSVGLARYIPEVEASGETRLVLAAIGLCEPDNKNPGKVICQAVGLTNYYNMVEAELETFNISIEEVSAILLATLALLASPLVGQERIGASEKINRKRKTMNRPPLPHGMKLVVKGPYTTFVEAFRAPRPPSEDHGGTHASPIPHDRRGHLRRLRSGRLISVRPSLVLGGGTERTHYAIQPPSPTQASVGQEPPGVPLNWS